MTAPRPWVLTTVVVALAIAVFVPALSGGWIYDDQLLIHLNRHAHSLGEWRWWFTHDFWHIDEEAVRAGGRVTYWRPLVSASYAFDWQVGGGSPLVFHLTNLFANGLVGLLSFAVLRRWIGAIVPAALAAALFIVHPTKAESVAWISGRTDVLCMIAMLVATIGIGRRLRGEHGGLALEIGGTIAAYLCKEQAIVMPAFALVELWLFLDKPAIDLAFVKRSVRAVAPQTLIALAYLVVRSVVLPVRTSTETLLGFDHLLAILDSFGRFVALTFAPVKLTIQQGLMYSLSRPTHDMRYVALGAGSIVAGTVIAFALRKRWPALTLGLIFFAVTIAPTANIIPTGIHTLISERFLYLPMFGVALIAGDALARSTGPRARLLGAVLVVATVLFAWQSARRSADYADEAVFWKHELAINPDSREAHQFLFAAEIDARHYQTALRELLEMKSRIRSADLGVEFALQIAEVSAQLVPDLQVDDLRAIDSFAAQVLDKNAETATLSVRGVTLGVNTKSRTFSESIDRLSIRLWEMRAQIATRLGEMPHAKEMIAHAVELCPHCLTVVTTQALVLARVGDIEGGLGVLDSVKGVIAEEPLARIRARLLSAREHRDAALNATGPAAVQASAQELATLELWGLAYQMMAPHKAEIEQAPGVAMGFAELAFRAGAADVAKEVLATQVPPDQIDAKLQEWGVAMGWLL